MPPMAKLETPPGYRALDEAGLPDYLARIDAVAGRLGGGAADWRITEVGDGNLNLVFLVDGPKGSVCVKQALPYVRLVGEGWPLSVERAFFEQQWLLEHGRHVGRLVPEFYHYHPALYLIVMEKLAPHIIMRRGMIEGIRYPRFAEQISDYMSRSLFFTSDLAVTAEEKKAKVGLFCGNTELCRITEDLIFTDPYRVHERNRWTSPQLDGLAAELREDAALKIAVSRLKLKFLTETQALLHGDLHTGSIMITPEDARVIDGEFAFYGPIGFDVGAVLGNLLMNYFAQDGHATEADDRSAYKAWVLETVEAVWTLFERKFLDLWRRHATGDAYPAALFEGPVAAQALEAERRHVMAGLFADSLGFAAAKTIRRIFGLAHNIDFERIEDPSRRAACEAAAVALARRLMTDTSRFRTIRDVTEAAQQINAGAPYRARV